MEQRDGILDDPRSLTCGGISWETIGPPSQVPFAFRFRQSSGRFFNLGQRTWPLVVNGKSNPSAGACWASACPTDAASSPSLAQKRREFVAGAKNFMGVSVLTVRYAFVVQPGSSADSTQWIRRVNIEPAEVSAALGWSVDMNVAIQEPCEYVEAGTSFAFLAVSIDVVLSTKIKQLRESKLHLVSPAGVFTWES